MKEGWQVKKLGEVCTTIQDGAHESPQKQFDSPGEGRFLYITSKNIRTNYLELKNISYVERDFHDRIYPRCQPEVGDVLLTKDGANTGNVALNTIDEPFSLLSSVCLIKTNPTALNSAFLCYYLQSPDGLMSIIGQMTGAAIKRIILRDVKLATIPLPPLPEQQRIVALLDEAFEAIASAKAHAEQNLKNARGLFESQLDAVFRQRGEGWVEKTLEELGTITSSKRIFKNEYVESGVPFYRTKEIKQLANKLPITTELFISQSRYDEVKSNSGVPKLGDVLLTAIGTIGEIYVVDGEGEFYFKDGNVLWLKEFHSIDSYFLKYVLRSFVDSLNNMAHGSAYSALPIQRLNAHRIFVPSIEEQRKIVAELDDLESESQNLESVYRRKIAALDELKASLLHKAFAGEL